MFYSMFSYFFVGFFMSVQIVKYGNLFFFENNYNFLISY